MPKIQKTAQAGTLESNDIMVAVASGTSGIKIDLDSIVLPQYGDVITQIIENTIREQGIDDIIVKAIDRGALDCTIRARTLTALGRAGVVLKEVVW